MTPTTETGKRLIADCEGGGIPASGSLGSHIAAIEQEARAAALRDAPLDAERLARALFEAERPGDWPTWDDYIGAFGSPGIAPWRRKADRIVAEYAALAAAKRRRLR